MFPINGQKVEEQDVSNKLASEWKHRVGVGAHDVCDAENADRTVEFNK